MFIDRKAMFSQVSDCPLGEGEADITISPLRGKPLYPQKEHGTRQEVTSYTPNTDI